MAIARRQVPGSVLIWIVLLVLLALWLTRYEYQGTQIRRNRFTGETQKRMVYQDGSHEWVPWRTPFSRDE